MFSFVIIFALAMQHCSIACAFKNILVAYNHFPPSNRKICSMEQEKCPCNTGTKKARNIFIYHANNFFDLEKKKLTMRDDNIFRCASNGAVLHQERL